MKLADIEKKARRAQDDSSTILALIGLINQQAELIEKQKNHIKELESCECCCEDGVCKKQESEQSA